MRLGRFMRSDRRGDRMNPVFSGVKLQAPPTTASRLALHDAVGGLPLDQRTDHRFAVALISNMHHLQAQVRIFVFLHHRTILGLTYLFDPDPVARQRHTFSGRRQQQLRADQ
ncbi:hypothetical protein D3C81_984720 [compost metagenome]